MLFPLKFGAARTESPCMGKNTIIKTVAVVAFSAAALGNGIALEQSNTVTWYDALHAFCMLTGALAAIAASFVELPE